MSFSKPPADTPFMRALQKATPARIGIGHAGGRYRTESQLKFREDLAASRDAVHREVPPELLDRLGFTQLQTGATSRREYLMHTAAGRFLNPESVQRLEALRGAPCDVQLVASDGLSSEAFESNVESMLPLLQSRLLDEKLTLGPLLFVKWARVAVVDAIGAILRPRATLILIGERPGLGISDSLSGYFEYAPGPERLESDRNVLSNIHRRGVPPPEAALMLAEALIQVLALKKSGMSVRFDFT